MADGCLVSSSPAIFIAKTHQRVSLRLRPIKLHLSASFTSFYSSSSSLSLRRKSNSSRIVPFVAYQQEEYNTLVLQEDEEQGGELSWENENRETEAVKIFVGNLPFEVDREQLAQLFQQTGVVEISEVIYNKETGQSRGFGFVTMSTVEETQNAVDMFHGYELGGRYLTVNKAVPRGSMPERAEGNIHVGNLPWDVDDVRLEQLFSEHGKVVNAQVVYDRQSGRSRGFGYVTMSSESEVNDAIKNLDGQIMGGRAIRVNVAEEKPKHHRKMEGTGGAEEYSLPPEDAKIFVRNMPYDVNSELLAQLFQRAGVVVISEVIYNRETGQSRGFGFVTMSTVEEAERAVRMFHGYELLGRHLTVTKALPRRSMQKSAPKIYVGNLPQDVDDVLLEQLFSVHGKVVNAQVVYDVESGLSRGFGIVRMSSESEVNDAILNLDGQSIGGRAIRVNLAEERPMSEGF